MDIRRYIERKDEFGEVDEHHFRVRHFKFFNTIFLALFYVQLF